ncbi:DUF2339 domain-containing protein [Saccharicrinis aurantiacus]|uniref:DUF2339 domain-containing protein n=1 Tax=Saccharicrinis aurantiacus TaxID=1849719 RepID=UPI0008398CD2|nr:DUF2339 domain-containing protein [Saccharicrinis aurantiacus]
MNELIKKHWITALGILFLFSSFAYFLKMAFDNGWFPPEIRILAGFAMGTTLLFFGYHFYHKKNLYLSQILSGTGMSAIYATFSYVAFADGIHWPYNITFISILALTVSTTYVSYYYNLRGLMFISMMGGLLSPIFMKAQANNDLLLFAYVFILNVGALYMSISKKWPELRAMSFVLTVAIYTSYYICFDPDFWMRPFFYAATLFVSYMVGSIYASYREKDCFSGWNLYLSLINAMLFIFWSIYILDSFSISFTVPLMVVGFTFLLVAAVIFYLTEKRIFPSALYVGFCLILFAMSASNIKPFGFQGLEYVIATLLWLLITVATYTVAIYTKTKSLVKVSYGAWFLLIAYWVSNAWDVQWIELFGIKYLPFLNAGALTWMLLAAFGFYISKKEQAKDKSLSVILAIISNVIVGGLFAVQINNLWLAYDIASLSKSIVLSCTYIVYALFIFLWGSYIKEIAYRIMGSIVIIATSVKVFFWDLSGEANISKMLFLMLIGVLTLGIAYINNQWFNKQSRNIAVNTEDADGDVIE